MQQASTFSNCKQYKLQTPTHLLSHLTCILLYFITPKPPEVRQVARSQDLQLLLKANYSLHETTYINFLVCHKFNQLSKGFCLFLIVDVTDIICSGLEGNSVKVSLSWTSSGWLPQNVMSKYSQVL
jgi:hypothetical protein